MTIQNLGVRAVVAGLVFCVAAPEAAAGVLSREGDTIVANASVVQYAEITPDNIDSFHFHGSTADYPISAVIAVPNDRKSGIGNSTPGGAGVEHAAMAKVTVIKIASVAVRKLAVNGFICRISLISVWERY